MVIPTTATALPEQLHQALRHINLANQLAQSPLLTSLLVTEQQSMRPELSSTDALQLVLTKLVADLAMEQPKAADLLHGRFWEALTVAAMVQANRPEAQSERRFYQQQEQALQQLAMRWEQAEARCRHTYHRHRLLNRLPLQTYEHLFGVEGIVECLLHALRNPHHHFILSIKGIGGIGKTALADYAVRRYLVDDDQWQELVWVSAKQEHLTSSGVQGIGESAGTQIHLEHIFDELGYKLGLPEVLRLPLGQKVEKLAALLRTAPHLIVIDNLETIVDFQRLTSWLTQLVGPTKFLLTSRVTVPSLTRVTTVALNELDAAASLALINYIATVKEVTDYDAQRIYDLVGGNPLAIILLVSQMQTLPPLEVCKSVRLGNSDEIYRYIYWRSWQALTLPAQELLFAIQRAGDVASWQWLQRISKAPPSTVQAALNHLIDLSLVQPQRGNDGQRAYVYKFKVLF